MLATRTPPTDTRHAAHLEPEVWQRVNRLLLSKALSEFSHESLLTPEWQQDEGGGWAHYQLTGPASRYDFRARQLSLAHWQIDADSIRCQRAGADQALDVLSFVIEFRTILGLSDEVLPLYLDELSSTLYGSAYKHAKSALTADELTRADFQSLESAMMEGHPVFVANNGRIGFSDLDYRAYAPETGQPMQLVWLAVDRQHAHYSHIDGLSFDQLMQEELGAETLARYQRLLREKGLDPNAYWFMPVHPWQWHNRLVMAFAAEIAQQRIVFLGHSADAYQAQQSIRTLFNLTHPSQRYVKSALSILNMGFMRGLSPDYMHGTPAINQWLKALVDADPELRQCGFGLLCEQAAIGYRQPYYEAATRDNNSSKKMLSTLWRESPLSKIRPGERLMTMAGLLHIDPDGQSLLFAMIQASTLSTEQWVRRYLNSYLRPLLHCFYQYDLVFMPHGENLILILDAQVPVRVLMKDIAEEIALLNSQTPLPEAISRVALQIPDELKTLSIFTDIFDCFFRHLAALLEQQADYSEQQFWAEVAACILDYQHSQPQLADKFARYDLFAPQFIRSCLNRLQIANNRQMINLADPGRGLQLHGHLANPIAAYRESASS